MESETTAELHALLSDATFALGELNADALESLRPRALALERRGPRRIPRTSVAEVEARLRVFAAVMQATRNNLDFLKANASRGVNGFGPGSGRGVRWDR